MSHNDLFVFRAIALLTQTLPQRHLVGRLMSLRTSSPSTSTTKALHLTIPVSCMSPVVHSLLDGANPGKPQDTELLLSNTLAMDRNLEWPAENVLEKATMKFSLMSANG